MTAKQFFKSTAFKCIAVLLSVLLVSGVLLAVAYGFLEVTDEERFSRKIGVMYGGEAVTATEQDISGKKHQRKRCKNRKIMVRKREKRLSCAGGFEGQRRQHNLLGYRENARKQG